MIRGLEKNNEGENLTKHETKNSGEQWRTQDLAKGSHNRGSGGKALSRQRPRGSGGQQIFAVFTLKNALFSALFNEKEHAGSAVIVNNAKYFCSLCLKAEAWLKQ